MVGNIYEYGVATESRVKFEVNSTVYEGRVKMLTDGTMAAVSDFKPVAAVPDEQPVPHFQSKPDTDRAINHSIAAFWADKSKSDKILDPVWLDIGVVSVATAYHPACGKVTFVAQPVREDGTGKGRLVFTYSQGMTWKTCECNTLVHAKNVIGEQWINLRSLFEKPIPPDPESTAANEIPDWDWRGHDGRLAEMRRCGRVGVMAWASLNKRWSCFVSLKHTGKFWTILDEDAAYNAAKTEIERMISEDISASEMISKKTD